MTYVRLINDLKGLHVVLVMKHGPASGLFRPELLYLAPGKSIQPLYGGLLVQTLALIYHH